MHYDFQMLWLKLTAIDQLYFVRMDLLLSFATEEKLIFSAKMWKWRPWHRNQRSIVYDGTGISHSPVYVTLFQNWSSLYYNQEIRDNWGNPIGSVEARWSSIFQISLQILVRPLQQILLEGLHKILNPQICYHKSVSAHTVLNLMMPVVVVHGLYFSTMFV